MKIPVRFAILSFAHFHANFWAKAILDSPKAEMIGIWDDDPVRGQDAAARFNTSYWEDLDALLASCDAVGITSETVKHADLVERAAHAGVHILLEKPLATNLEEADRISQVVQETGVTFMQNFPKRYDPVNDELVQLVKSGKIGEIVMVRVRHGNHHLLDLGEQASQIWYSQPQLSGGGALIDEGIHAADFLLRLLGYPQSVIAMTSNTALGLPVDDSAVVIYKYTDGKLAEIATSNTFVGADESVQIFGPRGTIILSGVDMASKELAQPPFLRFFQQDEASRGWQGSSLIPEFQKPEFHHGGPNYFLECLLTGKPPIATLDESRMTLTMVLAAYRAAETGQIQYIKPFSSH